MVFRPAILGDAAVDDMCTTVRRVAPVADLLVLNLSCPNTSDGRSFQEPEALRELLKAAGPARGAVPLFVKISPDLDAAALGALADEALRGGVAGFVATNTTRTRAGLQTPLTDALSAGGLSGAPLAPLARSTVTRLRELVGPRVPIVGCGGVATAGDFRDLLASGADLVELYTGFIYEGPLACRRLLAAGA